MMSLVFAFVLIALFIGFEGPARKSKEAKTLDWGKSDLGTTRLLAAAFAIAVLVLVGAVVLDYLQIGTSDSTQFIGWIGVSAMLFGIALRSWASRVLGEFYTRTLLTTKNQRIVQDGPYKVIRHPGYLGIILLWVGGGLATANWIATAVISTLMFVVYAHRIGAEEKMLQESFGEQYRNYAARTWKLIPFVY